MAVSGIRPVMAEVKLLYIRRHEADDLSPLHALDLATFLSPYELLRLKRFSRADLREQWLLGRALREVAFRKYWQLAKPALSLGVNGKPQLTDYPSMHFNLAHHPQIIAVALADVPVGVDVEMQQRSIRRERLLAKHFSVAEAADINASAEPDKTLLAHWCVKEAYIKALGAKIAGSQLPAMTLKVNSQAAMAQRVELSFAPDYCAQLWQVDAALLAAVAQANAMSVVMQRISVMDVISLLTEHS